MAESPSHSPPHPSLPEGVLPPESQVLQSLLLNSPFSVDDFFQSVWQNACALFRMDTSAANNNPLQQLLNNRSLVIDLLQHTQDSKITEDIYQPLLFRHQKPVPRADYDHSLVAAYLDGCSIVLNHSDRLHPLIAALCQDLQLSFPHAYANTYLTPRHAQAVPPHADDRDVLVLQICGSKQWTVYQNIPVPYPYPPEQVGKDGMPVPEAVTKGPVLIHCPLTPGQCLYMPRGYVHEAAAGKDFSFHVTVALATHDWTLAGLLTSAGDQLWHSVIDYRKAVPRAFGTREWGMISQQDKELLQSQLNQAFDRMRENVTLQVIHETLQRKYYRHNQRVEPVRRELMEFRGNGDDKPEFRVVGPEAARHVILSTLLRLATPEEKARLAQEPNTSSTPRGLLVREENHEAIMSILTRFRSDPHLTCTVEQLQSIAGDSVNGDCVCELTLLCFARRSVEFGALAVAHSRASDVDLADYCS